MSGPQERIEMVDGSSPTWDRQGPHYPPDTGTGSRTTSSVVKATGMQIEKNDANNNNESIKRPIDEVDVSSDEEQQNDNWPRFLFLEGTNPEKSLWDMSPFMIQKCIQVISTEIKITNTRSGLILECSRQHQSRQLLKMTLLHTTPVKVTPHRSMNTCQGIIRCPEVNRMSEEELLKELSIKNNIIQVKRFKRKIDGQLMPTNTLLLTFGTPKLPRNVLVAYLSKRVEPFIPNPLRCFRCQKFGHNQKVCRGIKRCGKCNEIDHDEETCPNEACCGNCGGKHLARDKLCPVRERV